MKENQKKQLNKAEKAAVQQSPKRVSKKTLKRRRMIKRILSMLLVVFVVTAAIFVAMKLLFVVRTVEISGSDIFTEKEISDFVAIPQEENIFRIDSEEMEQALVEEFKYLEQAKIVKRLPDRVEIHLTDCVETYYTLYENTYTVYSQGFKNLRNSQEPPLDAVWLDFDMSQELQLDTAKTLIQLFEKYHLDKVTKISLSDDNMISVVCDDRIEINFGTMLDIDYKIKMCKKVLDEKIPAGEKGTIDATEGGEIVYRRQ